MDVVYTALSKQNLSHIKSYIAQDNITASHCFIDELKIKIEALQDFPYQCQQSKYSNDSQVRDMVFTGYTIIYRINTNNITVLQIFNQNLPIVLCN